MFRAGLVESLLLSEVITHGTQKKRNTRLPWHTDKTDNTDRMSGAANAENKKAYRMRGSLHYSPLKVHRLHANITPSPNKEKVKFRHRA